MVNFLVTTVYLLIFTVAIATPVMAQEVNQFISVVNPVRVPKTNVSPALGLKEQYSIISNLNLPATWLVTYDVLDSPDTIEVLKSMHPDQEIGLFLEVTPNFSDAASVIYHSTGSWHFANAVFLSGYTQAERLKLIDTVFEKYRMEFGDYPKSVGSWGTDIYSLSYMQKKYAVTANLDCSDQFGTDNYYIWGQYWSTPFYPSTHHSLIPATSDENKLGIVTIQWAHREPFNGYASSLYSTQDYFVLENKQDISYFSRLLDLYSSASKNAFAHITVGLEADLPPGSYASDFTDQMRLVSQKISSKEVKAVTMKNFADWYKTKFPDLSPPHVVFSQDFLNSKNYALWYNSPEYRLGIQISGQTAKIIDFRTYNIGEYEPYYLSPNRDKNLYLITASIIDNHQDENSYWELELGEFVGLAGDPTDLTINFRLGKIQLTKDRYQIFSKNIHIPDYLKNEKKVSILKKIDNVMIKVRENYSDRSDGVIFSHLTSETIYTLKSPKSILGLLIGRGWSNLGFRDYFISDSEMDALSKLRSLPKGDVLVVDSDCLQCEWHGQARPAVFANHRSYVTKYSGKKIIKSKSIFSPTSRVQAKDELIKSGVKYIYTTQYEDYIEAPPFSPGDLGIKLIYISANAKIWEVL